VPDASSFCFVHVADLHLDTPFRGLSAVAPGIGAALRDASLQAFDTVVELTLERRAAFLLVAGDLYDGPERGLRAQLRVRDGLARLGAAGVSSFVVHGNHDPLETGWSAIRSWPAGTTVFAPPSAPGTPAEVVPVVRDGVAIATVQGVSFATRSTTENLARRLARPRAAWPGGGEPLHVGLLHCKVAGSPGDHADNSPCTMSDLRATGLDYLALGHVHERSVLSRGSGPGDPFVVYPGNTQAHSWRAGEHGAKGAYVVHVEAGRIAELEFVPCDQVRFEELACPIDELDDLGQLADRLAALGDDAARRAGGRAAVLRAELTGSGALHGELTRAGALDELLAHLRDDAARCSPLRWWDCLRPSSHSGGDLAALASRGDFAADLLDLAASLQDDEALAAPFTAAMLNGLPRPLARRVAELVAGGTPTWLLERATRAALDELALDR
jgi:exonuclease SbcD